MGGFIKKAELEENVTLLMEAVAELGQVMNNDEINRHLKEWEKVLECMEKFED